MRPIPEEREDLLHKTTVGHVATVGPRGEPQSNPVWIDWDGEHLMFSQTPGRQKVHNLKRDPRIAISIHDPDEPLRYLEIRGRVDSIEDDRDYAFINKMAKKYLGKDTYPWLQPDEHRVIVRVRPEHATMQ
ncbi:MAG TPA: PPOX class F420-dependent oxidoreductase [Actinopolymorphaceae bacterium]